MESTSHFDADALRAAMEEPTLTVGRCLYRGRLLSIEEWLPFWERQDALRRDRETMEPRAFIAAQAALHRDYLRAIFPKRDYRFWAPDPVKHLMAQPFEIVDRAVLFFFILQAFATWGKDAVADATSPKTDGPSSPAKTPDAPGAT